MKEVCNKLRDFISPSEVNDNLYYGTLDRGNKGFILREKFRCGCYRVISQDKFTLGNYYSSFNNDNLQETIEALIESKFKVFEFKTNKELFKWLSEE